MSTQMRQPLSEFREHSLPLFPRLGRVDPCRFGQLGWRRRAANEAFGVRREGLEQNGLSAFDHCLGLTVVDRLGRQQTQPAMIVLGVVPLEERAAEGARVLG